MSDAGATRFGLTGIGRVLASLVERVVVRRRNRRTRPRRHVHATELPGQRQGPDTLAGGRENRIRQCRRS